MEPRRPPARHRLRLLGAVLVAVAAASACGSGPLGRGPAATVAGTDIGADAVRELVEAQVAYLDAAVDAGLVPEEQLPGLEEQRARYQGVGRDTMATVGVAEALTSLIELEVLEAVLVEQGGQVDDALLDERRAELTEGIQGQGIEDLEPFTALVDAEVRRQVVLEALAEALADPDEREAQLRAAFEGSVDDFTQVCAQVLVTEDEPSARAALDRVEAGEDFGAVAAEVSTDPSGEAQGGDIGCVATADLAGVLGEAAYGVGPGDRIPPTEADFGWVVAQVNEVQVPTLEDLRPQLEQTLPDLGQEAVRVTVEAALADTDVTVDARYGTWDAEAGIVVAPPDPGADPPDPAGGDPGEPVPGEPAPAGP